MIIDEIAFRSLLGKGEHIKYVAHVNMFTIYPQLFRVFLVGLLMPAIGYYLFPPFYSMWLGWGCLGATLFIYRIIQWYLDAWIITNQSVIDQNWQSFFQNSTTRIEYNSIEGITYERKGFWATILGYGRIQIEHMSGQPVSLENVSRPKKVERVILLHQQTFVREQNFQDHGQLKDLLVNLLRSAPK